MAGFKAHITTSSLAGVAYGVAGYQYGLPLSCCLIGGGLCSVSGMLPDLDSDSGVPVRETFAFCAAAFPMLLVHRLEKLGLEPELMFLAGALFYLLIRFGVSAIFKKYTVHRGMWHSIPAAFVAAGLAFLAVADADLVARGFKAGGVFLGFMSHLILDEIWSIDVARGKLHIKKSFGTALKFWSSTSMWANISTYGKLLLVAALVYEEPVIMQQLERFGTGTQPATATQPVEQTLDRGNSVLR